MGYWIYIQAFLDVALLAALGALLVERRRRLPVAAWQREVGALVETLGELVVEVDRIAAHAAGTSEGVAPPDPAPPETVREAVENVLAAEVFGASAAAAYRAEVPAEPAFLPADNVPGPSAASLFPPPAPARTKAGASEASEPAAESLSDEVLACAREGLAPEAIARRVGRPVGEVTLVLGLSRAHAAPVGG